MKIPDVFTDIEDLLELDQVDAVIIATPNHLHEPHVLRALKSKVDVLCERAMEFDVIDVPRIGRMLKLAISGEEQAHEAGKLRALDRAPRFARSRELFVTRRVVLDVAEFNERARKVYESVGFRVTGHKVRQFPGWGAVPFVDMELVP